MQNGEEYGGTNQAGKIGGEEGAGAEQVKQLLASGLPPPYRRAYRILGNAADAEDALRDALLAAYTHLDQSRGQAQLSTWLTTIVLNCARLHLRRRPNRVLGFASPASYRRSRVTFKVHELVLPTVSLIAQPPWFGNCVALMEVKFGLEHHECGSEQLD